MELVFEILDTRLLPPEQSNSKTFGPAGGVIGRAEDCDWRIEDVDRHLSNRHAQVSFQQGAFYITDSSCNGTLDIDSGVRLLRGQSLRIDHGRTFELGKFRMRARLLRSANAFDAEVGRPMPAGSVIPDDSHLELDPLKVLAREQQGEVPVDELKDLLASDQEPMQRADYTRIDHESLLVPQLIVAPQAPPAVPKVESGARHSEAFWDQFGTALGVDLQGLDQGVLEALAINAAGLLKQSIGGLQQSLRTRNELKSELRLAQTSAQDSSKNPLKFASDAGQVLGLLLQSAKPGQLSAAQSVWSVFHDLQAHQVALLAASRAAVRATLDHFAPQQLTLRFERDGRKPLLATAGSRWRAYGRYHQALCQDDDWSERLLARDFAQAYEEQIRLIATLNTDPQG